MDNFRKHTTPRKSSRGGTDGFAKLPRRTDQVIRRGSIGSDTRPVSRIDNFKGKEGFRTVDHSKLNPMKTAPVASRSVRRPTSAVPAGGMKLDLPKSSGEKHKKRSRKKLLLRTGTALFLVVFILGGIFFGNAYLKAKKIFGGGGNAPALDANVDPTKLKGEGDGRVNVLMLGKGGPGHDGADLTDTILIMSIDPIQKDASMLSIPRDFWVKTDTGQSKINAVYANAKYKVLNGKKTPDVNDRAEQAGLAAIETEIEEVFGVPIHYNVMIDFAAFEKAINTVGGIDINVTKDSAVYERLWNPITRKNYVLDVKPGQQHFDGERALFYARSRHTSARGDFARAERQRAVILGLKDKVMSAGTYGNPVKINQLVNEFGDHVRSNLSTGEVLRVYDIMKSIDSSKIGSLGLADPPNVLVETGMVNGQSVVKPIAGTYDYTAIRSFVRNSLKDGYIKNENASIAVYNGSTITGMAGKRADELKSFGYNITTVANAPTKDYGRTTLVDLTNGKKKYTKNYLEKRLKVTATTTLPPGIDAAGAEFVIILGQNESASQ